jgi:rubrerythrin
MAALFDRCATSDRIGMKEVGLMAFNQTKDLLDVAREFHVQMEGLYRRMLKRAASEETIQLIRTLIEHEKTLEQQLCEYEDEVSGNILETYFKFMVEKCMKCFDDYVLPQSMSSMDVIETTRNFDRCLAQFYKDMAAKAQVEHVREVLLNLMNLELREQMNLSRRTLELTMA